MTPAAPGRRLPEIEPVLHGLKGERRELNLGEKYASGMNDKPNLTVGELIDHLSLFPRDATVFFGGSLNALTFYRTKLRGEHLVQIEFNENVYLTDAGEVVVENVR